MKHFHTKALPEALAMPLAAGKPCTPIASLAIRPTRLAVLCVPCREGRTSPTCSTSTWSDCYARRGPLACANCYVDRKGTDKQHVDLCWQAPRERPGPVRLWDMSRRNPAMQPAPETAQGDGRTR